jgi:hypothetical protein
VPLEDPESHIVQIAEQVKPVGGRPLGSMDRIRCALSGTLRVLTTTVTTDHGHAGMRHQPRREGLCAPIREQIDCAMSLQIDEDTAIGATTPEGNRRRSLSEERSGPRR